MHPSITRFGRLVFRTLLVAAVALVCARRAEAAASCTISVNGVSFGAYDVFSATALDSTGTVTISCRGNAINVSVTLSKGAANSFSPRAMSSGADTLTYNLFTDAARSTIWGDGTGGTSTYTNAGPANNTNIAITVYARISSGQDVRAGSYSDTVTAIVNF